MYTWDSVREYHFDFHQAKILEGIDDLVAWKKPDHKLKQYLLVPCPAWNTNPHENRNAHPGNSSLHSTKVCFKWNSKKNCPSNCRFLNALIVRAIILNAVVPPDILSKGKAKISSMNGLNVTDLISDWSNNSTEYRMSSLSMYILFLQLSLIPVFVMYNWLRDVAWIEKWFEKQSECWNAAWAAWAAWELRHDLSRDMKQIRHQTKWDAKEMEQMIDETQNTWDKK